MVTGTKFFQNSIGEYLEDVLQPQIRIKQKYKQHSSTRYINVNKKDMCVDDLDSNLYKRLPELYTKKEDCCGCAACYAVCPMSGEKRPEKAKRGKDGNIGSNGDFLVDFFPSGYSYKADTHKHTGAISMFPDEEGFLYPVVDAEICIRCYLCERVCAFNEKDDETRK